MNTKPHTVFALLALACISGCNSPTLPLPPPDKASIATELDGTKLEVRIIGKPKAVEPFAVVTCFNNQKGVGTVAVANESGEFDIALPGEFGDFIEIWQRVGNDPPAITMRIEE